MLTLQLPPEIEQAFVEGAERRGVPLETYLQFLLETASTPSPARALLGKYAHLPVSSENIAQARRQEIERDINKS